MPAPVVKNLIGTAFRSQSIPVYSLIYIDEINSGPREAQFTGFFALRLESTTIMQTG